MAVLLDASVLFPAALRDTLLRAAGQGLYRPRWTEEILEEVRRNLVSDLGQSPERSRRPTIRMRQAFPDALIDGYQGFEAIVTNHPKDRHVLAAAVAGGVGAIVTSNLRHFPDAALDPYASSPNPRTSFCPTSWIGDPTSSSRCSASRRPP